MKKKALSFITLLPCLILFGMILGGAVVARFMERSPNGWDQLADFLGGVMVGGLAGLVLAVVLSFVLSPNGMLKTAAVAALGFLLVFGLLWLTQPKREGDRDASPTPPSKRTSPTEPTVTVPVEPGPVAAGVEPVDAISPEEDLVESAPPDAAETEGTSSAVLPCESADGREAFAFSGSLGAGEGYRETFGPGWEVALEPLPGRDGVVGRGWEIQVLERSAPDLTAPAGVLSPLEAAERDLAQWTPPLRGPNPRVIEASNFVVDGQPNDGTVNAPQRLRFFLFSPQVGRSIGVNGNAPTAEEVDQISAFGRGGLELTELEMAPAGGEASAFRRIAFRGCITWPRDGRPSAGALMLPGGTHELFRTCGLPEELRPVARLDPPLRMGLIDGDSILDQVVLARRDEDGAMALAMCSLGTMEVALLGPDEGVGELDPAYLQNIDWWDLEGGSEPGARLTLGKEGASSVEVYWGTEGWESIWRGD